MKKLFMILLCKGCLACQKTQECIIRDDANEIVGKMLAADNEESSIEGAVKGLQGWGSCFGKARLAGTVFGGGADAVGSLELRLGIFSHNIRLNHILLFLNSRSDFGNVNIIKVLIAGVRQPLFAAVAAIERASIRATDAICPLCSFEPSQFGKFLADSLSIFFPVFATIFE